MKILLVLTSAIAVFTADYHDNPDKLESKSDYKPGDYNSADQNENFPDNLANSDSTEESQDPHNQLGVQSFVEKAEISTVEPVAGHYSTDEEHETIEVPVLFTDGPPRLDSFEVREHDIKKIKGRNEMELRGKKQDEMITQLSKSLETFKYIMTHAYSELKVELESIRDHQMNMTNIGISLKEEQKYIRDSQFNITDSSSKLNTEVNSMTQNITDSNSKLETTVKSLDLNINNSISLIISKLDYIIDRQGCPPGFFWLKSSNQCFKMFNDSRRDFASTVAKCQAEDLMMAELKDPVTVGTFFMNKYSFKPGYIWLGARGDGSYLRWQRGGDAIPTNSSFWYGTSYNSVTTNHCLMLLAYIPYMKHPYNDIYWTTTCTNTGYALCELVNSG